jgi:protein pelota
MRILEEDRKRGIVKLKIDSTEDLIWLYYLIEKDDLITMKTLRKVKPESQRADSGEMVPMVITIRVEKAKIDEYADRIRITGIVVSAPEKFGIKGKHHTLNVSVGDVLEIEKSWRKEHYAIMEKALERSEKPRVLLIAMDERRATVALLDNFRLEEVAVLSSRSASKENLDSYHDSMSGTFKELISIIDNFIKEGVAAVIVGGPGFFKENFLSYLKEKRPDIAEKVRIYDASNSTMNGIRELIRRGSVDSVIRDLEMTKAMEVMDKFLELLARGSNLISYGIEDVKKSVQYGAAEKILISSDLLFSEEHRDAVLEILADAEAKKTDFHVVDSRSEVGEQLKMFGHIIAVLRFPVY